MKEKSRQRLTIIKLESLVTHIERAESAVQESRRSNIKPYRPQSKGFSKTSDKKQMFSERESTPRSNKDNKGEGFSNKDKCKSNRRDCFKTQYSSKRPKRTSHYDTEKIERHQEEGRCFNCRSKDHISRNCPDHQKKCPPMQMNAIGISPAEARLAAMKEGTKLGLYSVGLNNYLLEHAPTVS